MEYLLKGSHISRVSILRDLKYGSSRRDATVRPLHQVHPLINPIVIIQCRMHKTVALVEGIFFFFPNLLLLSFLCAFTRNPDGEYNFLMTSLKSVFLKCFPFSLVASPSNNNNIINPFPRLRSRPLGTNFQLMSGTLSTSHWKKLTQNSLQAPTVCAVLSD